MAWFRKQMWLDVEGGWCGWIDAPNSGASAGATGWETSGTLLNGLGYATHSWGAHKRYVFEWPDSSARQAAQFMKSLRDGTYGRGLIHFIEPTLYDQNVLPARVADPSISLDDDGPSLVYGVEPTSIATPSWRERMLPIRTARYNLDSIASGYRGDAQSVYVAIPEGYALVLGAFYSATGSGGVFAQTIGSNGTATANSSLTPLSTTGRYTVFDEVLDARAVRIWIGKTAPGSASVDLTALCARLIPADRMYRPGPGYGELPYGEGPYGGNLYSGYIQLLQAPWMGGMGNAGVRFDGVPTLIHNTGVNGGQVGYAASFIETGGW